MVGTALRDVSWTNSEVSAFCLTGQEERADVRSLQSSPKSLKHLCTSLSNCNVEMSLQSYVATITSQKEGGKRKGTNFPKCFKVFVWDCSIHGKEANLLLMNVNEKNWHTLHPLVTKWCLVLWQSQCYLHSFCSLHYFQRVYQETWSST